MSLPMSDSFLVTLQCSALGNLAAPFETPEDSPNVVGMIRDAEFLPYYSRDALEGPELVREPVGNRSFEEQVEQVLALCLVELARSTRYGSGGQSLFPSTPMSLLPSKYGSYSRVESSRDFVQSHARSQQRNSLATTTLEEFRGSMWSHGSYIGRSYTLLLRYSITRGSLNR